MPFCWTAPGLTYSVFLMTWPGIGHSDHSCLQDLIITQAFSLMYCPDIAWFEHPLYCSLSRYVTTISLLNLCPELINLNGRTYNYTHQPLLLILSCHMVASPTDAMVIAFAPRPSQRGICPLTVTGKAYIIHGSGDISTPGLSIPNYPPQFACNNALGRLGTSLQAHTFCTLWIAQKTLLLSTPVIPGSPACWTFANQSHIPDLWLQLQL
jgi:hypothetical protein